MTNINDKVYTPTHIVDEVIDIFKEYYNGGIVL